MAASAGLALAWSTVAVAQPGSVPTGPPEPAAPGSQTPAPTSSATAPGRTPAEGAAGATVADSPATSLGAIEVVASTANLIGGAVTSSQGQVLKRELELRPVYRVGQLLETMPGLQVTAHSGEGKANQYLLRGVNLDHGHDLATYIDEMPVNMRTHAHGQGYTDLNFLIPELAGGVDFTKGPYFASQGDFSAVGADHINLVNTIPTQVSASVGTVNDERLFGATTFDLKNDSRILAAGEIVHLDGPWTHPDNFRKKSAVVRFSHGVQNEGYSLTAAYYHGLWNATTDQPERAIASGLIDRYGTLDPSDGGKAERFSLSGRYSHGTEDWHVNANAYVVRNEMTLWNDFTHFLDDPINGDQHAQDDRRTYFGGAASFTRFLRLGEVESDTTVGVQGRYDHIYVDLRHTRQRVALQTDIADRVNEASLAAYLENTTYWKPWLRTVVGLREDWIHGDDTNLVGGLSGSESASILQPKGSIVIGPFAQTEFYVSAGQGFHSNDLRAGTAADLSGNLTGVIERLPLLVRASGEEVGVRSTLIPHVQAAVTLFQLNFNSELTYDADVGQTSAGPASRRRGVEVSTQYRPFRWIELNANIAVSQARYTGYSPAGPYIPDAPGFVASVGALIDNLGPWFGAVEYRDLGRHPLIEDNSITSPGYREVNLNIGYKITPKLKVQVDVFNLFNSKDDAADYFYADRLPGEPPEGVGDLHVHPLEPRSARFTISAQF